MHHSLCGGQMPVPANPRFAQNCFVAETTMWFLITNPRIVNGENRSPTPQD